MTREKREYQGLPAQFRPRPVTIVLPVSEQLIEDALEELRCKAVDDANACCGYFPAMTGIAGIDHDLPASRRLSEGIPVVEIDGRSLHFNFVRLSLVRQLGPSPFHLDSDAATALTGSVATLRQRLVSRLLLNLSSTNPRTLCFLNIEPCSVRLGVRGGYVHCRGRIPSGAVETAILHPRRGTQAHGLLFFANRVMHTGRDDRHGHFVMAFGREDAA